MVDELRRINPPPTVYQPSQITVADGGNKLTRGERKTVEEYRTQMAVITAQTAKTYDLKVSVQPSQYNIPSLVKAIHHYFNAQNRNEE